MKTTATFSALPDESGFDMYMEDYFALQYATQAGFAAAREWDKDLAYIPEIKWQAFARAAIATYIRRLSVDAPSES